MILVFCFVYLFAQLLNVFLQDVFTYVFRKTNGRGKRFYDRELSLPTWRTMVATVSFLLHIVRSFNSSQEGGNLTVINDIWVEICFQVILSDPLFYFGFKELLELYRLLRGVATRAKHKVKLFVKR